MKIDLNKILGKAVLKKILNEAFMAGGKYYLKKYGRGNIPKKDVGDIDNFETWYKKSGYDKKDI